MNWESTDGKLNPERAAAVMVAECFDGRKVDAATFRGQWHHSGRHGAWTFRLVGG